MNKLQQSKQHTDKLQHTQNVLFSKQQDFKLHTCTKSCGRSKKTRHVKEMHKKTKQEIQYDCQDQRSTFDPDSFQPSELA